MKNNKRVICLIIIGLFAFNSMTFGKSQDSCSNIITNRIVTVNLLLPGFNYEKRLLNTSSLKVYTECLPMSQFSSSSGLTLSLVQNFGIQFRYYYNLKDRMALGRNTTKNSLNYFGLSPVLSLPYKSGQSPSFSAQAVWGLQRSYNRWLLNFELGIATFFKNNNSNETVYPVFNFSFGYILFNRH